MAAVYRNQLLDLREVYEYAVEDQGVENCRTASPVSVCEPSPRAQVGELSRCDRFIAGTPPSEAPVEIETSKYHKEYYLSDGLIFLVEEKLFRVPKYMLENKSSLLHARFAVEVTQEGRGLYEHTPLEMPDVASTDFGHLLALLHPLSTDWATSMPSWGHARWFSILKLAYKFEMYDIRNQAIIRLHQIDGFPSPTDKIDSGKKYGYKPWIRDGFLKLITRETPSLSEEEGAVLGLKDALRCASAREEYYKHPNSPYTVKRIQHVQYGYSNYREEITYTGPNLEIANSILDKIFGKEIPKVGEVVKREQRESSASTGIGVELFREHTTMVIRIVDYTRAGTYLYWSN
ncbi:hypothetical protein BU17DRAFT_67888 [Hysterangium stoloniferum]|nr:hypothetical protein BU17DRAFT_67888 [Hysterangium stoloniferum]